MAKHFQVIRRGGRRLQELLELNQYPETPQLPYPAWEFKRQETKNSTNRRRIDVLEHPYTPNYGFYPAHIEVKANRTRFDRAALRPPEHNVYPLAPAPEQPPTAFRMPDIYIRHQKRKEIRVLEINVYPEAPPAPDVIFSTRSIISTNGIGASSAITSDGIGALSEIVPTNGLRSIIQGDGLGATSSITSTGKGIDSGL